MTPILKKPGLHPYDLANYRPVSNMSFMSNVVERNAYNQMMSYLQENNLMPAKQSAYRKYHSTETGFWIFSLIYIRLLMLVR